MVPRWRHHDTTVRSRHDSTATRHDTVDVDSAGSHWTRWNLSVVDFGRWFLAEHRRPRMAHKVLSLDAHEHSTVDFASASPRQAPLSTSSKLPLLVRSTSPLTHDTTGSLPDCQRSRNTDSNVSATLSTAPNMSRSRMVPVPVLLISRLNHSILIEYKDILIE